MVPGLTLLLTLATMPPMPWSLAGTDDALAGLGNPAALAVRSGSEFYALYNFRPVLWSRVFSNTTFLAKTGPLAAYWEPLPSRYGLALGLGERGVYSGVRFRRDSLSRWDLSALVRPLKQVSLGATWDDLGRDWGRVALGAAVRPIGDRLTLFGETYLVTPLRPMVGCEAEPLPGLKLSLKAFFREEKDSLQLAAGLSLGLGKAGLGVFGTNTPREIAGLVRLSSERRRTFVPGPKRVIELKLNSRVVDQRPGFSLTGSGPCRTTWSLLDLVNRATKDRSIGALVIDLEGAQMDFARVQELRVALTRFKAAGKKVYVYDPSISMGSCYVASMADKVVTHPVGFVSIPGMSAQMLFLKGTLEKLGLKPEHTRHGKYKSAVEMFSEDSMSPANREQMEALVDGAYAKFVSEVAAGRGLSRESLEALINIGFFTAAGAKAAGLVDTFCYRDELDSLLKSDLGRSSRVSDREYAKVRGAREDWTARPAIAVVYATGSIAAGESRTDFLTGEMTMGAQTMVKAIRSAAKDKRVKAILLRIDSPGGDGYASDLIWRALEQAKQKKPVVVSMAGVAASGGYYIACNANRIFALPGTITGSIGVFSLRVVTEGLYNKLGARRQVVKRGEHADAYRDLRESSAEEDTLMQGLIDDFYRSFLSKVAAGRNMSVDAVDSIGQGRVWIGSDAQRVGIVDELGGFLDALEYAKQAAKLRDCDLVFYPKPKPGLGADFLDFAVEQARKAIE